MIRTRTKQTCHRLANFKFWKGENDPPKKFTFFKLTPLLFIEHFQVKKKIDTQAKIYSTVFSKIIASFENIKIKQCYSTLWGNFKNTFIPMTSLNISKTLI